MLPRISPLAVAAAFCAALFVALPVTAQQDVTPPTLLDVSFEPEVIDTGKGPVTVTVTIRVEDDLSGFGYGAFRFELPGTTQRRAVDIWPNTEPIDGTRLNGRYVVEMVMPQYSGYGTWEMTSTFLADKVGNSTEAQKPADASLRGNDDPEWPAIFNGFGFVIAADDSDLPFRIFVPTVAHFIAE